MEISSLSHLVRSMIPREHMASIYSQGSLDTSTCGIGPDSTDMVSKINGQGRPVECFKLDAWWRNHVFGVRRNRLTQTHPPLCCEGSGESWGEVCSDHKTLHLETLTSSLYCRVPSQSIVYQISCDVTVCCPDLSTHMLLS